MISVFSRSTASRYRQQPAESEGTPAQLTTAVGSETAVVVPAALLAVTATRTVEPTSAPPSVYVAAVAPGTSTQVAPAESQRCHWNAKEVGAPVQLPVLPVSVWPACATPLIVGKAVFAGA